MRKAAASEVIGFTAVGTSVFISLYQVNRCVYVTMSHSHSDITAASWTDRSTPDAS